MSAVSLASARGFLRLVVIEHSVFALPFAYLAALTAMDSLPERCAAAGPATIRCEWIRWGDLALVTVAMVAARTFAMAVNRLVDRELDARNPRTAGRELVTGAVSVRAAVTGSLASLAVFLLAAGLLDPLALALAPVAAALLAAYPYGKRFTWLCHAMLGLAQAVAPIGAWVAVTGRWSWTAVVLGLAVGSWIGGFDLVYACQDVESDRREGVHSVPARFGVAAALTAARVAHAGTVGLLAWFGVLAGFGLWWAAGLAATAAALVYEHSIVRPGDLSRVNRAFFTVNGWVGIGLFAFALADLASR